LKFVLKATGWKDEKLMEEKINDVLDKVDWERRASNFIRTLRWWTTKGGRSTRCLFAEINPCRRTYWKPDPETSPMKSCTCCFIFPRLWCCYCDGHHDYMVINKFPARTIKTERGRVHDNATISMLWAA
jgi:cell division transport system ATP-binding protein